MSLNVTRQLNVDLHDTKYITINAKQFDKSSRFILITCYDQGNIIKLDSSVNYAYIRYRKADDFGVFNSCQITSEGKILVELTEQMLATPGMCYADLVILENTNETETPTTNATTSLVSSSSDANGNVNLSAQPPVYTTDDGEGNVFMAGIASTGEITLKGPNIVSTMLFCVNVISTAFNNVDIESSYEYNALNELVVKANDTYEQVIEACNTSAKDAEYYYEQTKSISDKIDGGLIPNGTIEFSELSSVVKEVGYMYQISNDFVTDDTFRCGAGVSYSAGTNVYYIADGYWDCLVGTTVNADTIILLNQTVVDLQARIKALEEANLDTRVTAIEDQTVLGVTE